MNAAATAIQIQPILNLAITGVFVILGAIAVPFANKLFDQVTANTNLRGNATAHATLDGVVQNGLAYAEAAAINAVTKVGPIETSNPLIAAAANFVIRHATDELNQLGGQIEQRAIDLVRAALQFTTQPAPAPATTETRT